MAKHTILLREERIRVAQRAAATQAAAFGHDIGYWDQSVRGFRGSCRNEGCYAHLDVSGADYDKVSSPTALKARCPYRASKGKKAA